jgi:hypothetical protein
MIVLAAIVAVSFLVVLALRFPPQPTASLNTNTTPPHTKATTPTEPATSQATTPASTHQTTGEPKALHVSITLSAPTWVEATIGSPAGRAVIADGGLDLGAPHGLTVDPATTPKITFTSRQPVYLGFGAPGNVTLVVNGHQVALPHVAAGRRVRVDASGAHAV